MKVSHWSGFERGDRPGRGFDDAIRKHGKKHGRGGGDLEPIVKPGRDRANVGSNSGYSSGGLEAPDGQTRDPFPPSLTAYIEILRSIAAYLRGETFQPSSNAGQGLGSYDNVDEDNNRVHHSGCPSGHVPPDVTTLAVGEEDGGGPIPVEPGGGIGDGAGPLPDITTLAVGEEDGGSPPA